jgi:hypothetical protein
MSEVKRQQFEAVNPVPFGVFWSEPDSRYMTSMVHLNCLEYQSRWIGWLSAQSEPSALREELATAKSVMAHDYELLQQRLTAADQRNADFHFALMYVRSQITDARLIDYIDRMVKPTESGASE